MQVDLSKKQYETLLKMLYLGNRVANSPVEPDSKDANKEYLEMFNYMLKQAGNFRRGTGKLADDVLRFEEDMEIQQSVEEYDDVCFRGELEGRLVARDMTDKYGEAACQKMNPQDREKKEQVFIQKREKEFKKNGINKLTCH